MARQGALRRHVSHRPGFQLWLALPPALECAESEAQYIGGDQIPRIGPARLIVGAYQDATSPVRALDRINYLLVTLKPGERWIYAPSPGHVIAWVAVSQGALTAGEPVAQGELAVFEKSQTPMRFEGAGADGATFVVGSAVPHPYPL